SCDLAYAATSATFAVSGINLGLFCSTPSVALSRMVGRKQALEMLLTGRFITAAEAQAVGLINRQASAADLPNLVKETALQIAAKDPKAVALGKSLFRRQIEMGLETAYAAAEEAMANNLAFPSAQEGISTFLARRGAA
ncbi:MAG: enoyl-CoA hydratase-related protein, partial [Caulobacteraceae bacterium]